MGDRDKARIEGFVAQQASVKSESKHNVGKDRRDIGRHNDRPHPTNQYPTKEGQSTSNKDVHHVEKDTSSTPAENATASIVPIKEKERSGKSYSSRRKERQQQRNEQ